MISKEDINLSLYQIYVGSGWESGVRIFLGVFIISFTIYSLVNEIRQLVRQPDTYYTSFWNWVDLCIIALTICILVLHVIRSQYQWVAIVPGRKKTTY